MLYDHVESCYLPLHFCKWIFFFSVLHFIGHSLLAHIDFHELIMLNMWVSENWNFWIAQIENFDFWAFVLSRYENLLIYRSSVE